MSPSRRAGLDTRQRISGTGGPLLHRRSPETKSQARRQARVWSQTPSRLISIAQDSTLHRAATLTSHFKSTPVGFEPTRGDPIGLAGRRLSRSAKVSSAQSARQLLAASRTHLPMPCHRLNLACTHSSTDSIHMHQPGIEPGSHRWRRCFLPLDH